MGILRRPAAQLVAVGVLALALQVLYAPQELLRIHGHSYEGGLGDTSLTQWWFAFEAHAVRHGDNLIFTTLLHPPGGVNAVQNVSMLAPGLLLLPVTATWGASTTFNLLVFLAAPLTAVGAFAWLRRHGSPVAAAVGTLPCAFTLSELFLQRTHPFLTFLVLPPLILIVLERVLAGEGRRRWNALLLGLLVAAQALTGAEVLVILVISVVTAVVLLAVQRPAAVGAAVRRAWLPVVGAGAVAAVLLAYPLKVLFLRQWHLSGPIQAADTYEAIPSDVVRRPPYLLFSPGTVLRDYQGAGSYLGPVLVALLVFALVVLRRDVVARTAFGVMAVITVLSWGGRLDGAPGHPGGTRLPWYWIEHRSLLLENATPSRFNVAVWFCVGLVVVRLLTAARSWHPAARAVPLLLVAAAFASVAPARPIDPPGPLATPTPPFFTSGLPGIPAGARLEVGPSPTGVMTQAMQWQIDSGFRFELLDANMSHPDHGVPLFFDSSALSQLLQPPADPTVGVGAALVDAARQQLPTLGICAVVIGPSSDRGREEAAMTAVTGRDADTRRDDVAIWYVDCPRPS